MYCTDPYRVIAGIVLAALSTTPLHAQPSVSVDRFYKDSQVRLISEAGPGSGYTAWARLVAQHLRGHVPGEPGVIVQSMIGAGGLVAANYMYSVAPRDGREIAALSREAPVLSLIGAPGVRYDSRKFNWLGTPTSESNVCVVSKNAPVRTLQDLRDRDVVLGTDGVGSGMHIFPTALNALVNTRFKVIDGYSDTGVVLLAIDRGEIHGACVSAETILHTRGDAIRSGDLRAVLQGGLMPNPKLPDVPFVLDLAATEEQREALRFLYSAEAFGRPYVAPPDVPPERIAALRQAFDDTFKDPDFLADAARQGYDVSPMSGLEMSALIEELAGTPKPIVARVAGLMGPSNGK